MHRIRIVPAAKLLQVAPVNNHLYQGRSNFIKMMSPACALVVFSKRDFYSSKPLHISKSTALSSNGYLQRWISKSNYLNKYKFIYAGYYLYELTVDSINYNDFYKEFKMPDTFYSWFVITELHMWLLMVRCMAEGSNGQIVRNNLVKAMWADVDVRRKQLKTKEVPVNQKIVKKQIMELSHQFNACIVAYDEGITGDDKVLASAIWRRILQSECNDPEKVEKLVHYIRKQTHLLEEIPWTNVMKREIKWQGLNLVKSN